MKISGFLKVSILLSLCILALAGYLLTSNPAPELTPATGSSLAIAGPSSEPADLPSDPPPVVDGSTVPERPVAPVPASPAEKVALATTSATPLQSNRLAARRIQAGAATPATPDPTTVTADAGANAPLPVPLPAAIVSGDVPASLPLALVSSDPGTSLNELQQMGMDSLRKGFIDAVGGPNQDTKDPAYLQRWLKATNESDALYKTMFGWNAYNQQQARAVQQAGGVKAFFEQQAAAQQLQNQAPR